MRRNSAFVLCLIAIKKILETPSKPARNCKEGGIALKGCNQAMLLYPRQEEEKKEKKKEEEEEEKKEKKKNKYSV